MRSITVDEVRKKFPNPLSRDEGGMYDVGKAFLTYLNAWDSEMYPSEDEIAEGLRSVNKKLTSGDAFKYAALIVEETDLYNDHEAAWDVLREALEKEA